MADSLPKKVKRVVWRGDDRYWTHYFTDTATGDAIDITGWTFLSQYRPDLDRGTVIATATCTITDGPAGEMVEKLPHDQADLLPGQTDPASVPVVYWDIQSTNLDGDIQTWQYAAVQVKGDTSDA